MPELTLTSSQRVFLRSAGRRLKAEVSVGKAGATEGVVAHVGRLLDAQELVKIRLAASEDRKEAAAELAAGLGAAVVDVVGRMVVLYRPNSGLPPSKRLHPPAK